MAIMTLRVLPNARLRGQLKCLILKYLQSRAARREWPCLIFADPVHRPHPPKPGYQTAPTGGNVKCTITPQRVYQKAVERVTAIAATSASVSQSRIRATISECQNTR